MSHRRGVTLIELLVAISLLSLLSVGILFALRIGLNAMSTSNERLMANRKVLGVERVLTQQIAGFLPVKADCRPAPEAPLQRHPFFQGEAQTMRFVSTYSLQEAGRGYPRVLEYQVIPGDDGVGVRLIVNEHLYTGPINAGAACSGLLVDPALGITYMLFRPVQISSASFVLADNLASCRFAFKEEKTDPEPDVWLTRWIKGRAPAAIRVDLAVLEPNPAKLQVPSIIVPIRVNRNPMEVYLDYK